MGLRAWFGRATKATGWRPSSRDPELVRLFGGRGTASGASVSTDTATGYTPILAGVRILSKGVASLPLHVMRRTSDGTTMMAPTHPTYAVLHDDANPEMTSYQWRETCMGHILLWGNAYSQIVRDGLGRAVELWPLFPDRMKVMRTESGRLEYRYTPSGSAPRNLDAAEVFHLRWWSHDGIIGMSPIMMLAEAIGTGMSLDEYAARFFANDARPGGIIEFPGVLDPGQMDDYLKSWADDHQGAGRAHRVSILEAGMKWVSVGIPPELAQFLESRRFQVEEVARGLQIPLHMMQAQERPTFASTEQQSVEFVTYTLRDWLVRWESDLRRQLFSGRDRGRFFAEFALGGLLRGDTEGRYKTYATAIEHGIMSPDEARRLENLPPIPGGGGEQFYISANLLPLGSAQMGGHDATDDVASQRDG